MKPFLFLATMFASCALLAADVAAPAAPAAVPAPLKVLLLTGQNNHNWKATTPVLKEILEKDGAFAVTVTEKPQELKPGAFKEYDVILSNWNTFPSNPKGVWNAEMRKDFIQYIESGKGFVVFHAGGSMFYDWPEYQKLVGAAWGKTSVHGKINVQFKPKFLIPEHPVLQGIPEFDACDEIWANMEVYGERNILMTAFSDRTHKEEPVCFTTQLGKGRCFNFVLGAEVPAMRNPWLQTILRRGSEWAAAGQVTARTQKAVEAETGAVPEKKSAQPAKPATPPPPAATNIPVPRNFNEPGPFAVQVAKNLADTRNSNPIVRQQAIDNLGMLRAYESATRLTGCLRDSVPEVRRQAAQTLAWCGGRPELPALIAALDDADWMTRQAAAYSLQNLTGMEFPFDALAQQEVRSPQAAAWAGWCAALKPGDVPADLRKIAGSAKPEEQLRAVRALGALGGKDAAALVVEILNKTEAEAVKVRRLDNRVGPIHRRAPEPLEVEQAPVIIQQAGLRALGRLQDPAGFEMLRARVKSGLWCSFAADALGEWGDARAVGPLLDMLKIQPAGGADGNKNANFIMSALCRLPMTEAELCSLQGAVPAISRQAPDTSDSFAVTLEPHAVHIYSAYLLARCNVADAAGESVMRWLEGKPVDPGIPAGLHANGNNLIWLAARPAMADRLVAQLGHADTRKRVLVLQALCFLHHDAAADAVAKILAESKTEAEYGYCPIIRFEEYNDPGTRWRPFFARALGVLNGKAHAGLLIRIMNDDRNSVDTCYNAADALAMLATPEALEAFKKAAVSHPFKSIQTMARECLTQHGMTWEQAPAATPFAPLGTPAARNIPPDGELPASIVFIKGDLVIPGYTFMDPWRQVYGFTDSGPEYRLGRNLFVLDTKTKAAKPLTNFTDGYVASCEVSYDGTKIIFSRREENNPWWQIFEINADGSGRRQITKGPYHHVCPNYLPDGSIMCGSTRLGHRDEYHGYPATGLTVMNPDGTDIQVVGINSGRDAEATVLPDGRVALNRIDTFYGNMKVEGTIYSMFPDGTHIQSIYGPERRDFWSNYVFMVRRQNWEWNPMDRYNSCTFSQPQPFGKDGLLCCTAFGLIELGKDRKSERFLSAPEWAVTSPYPIGNGKYLCATAKRIDDSFGNGLYGGKGNRFADLRFRVDLADYTKETAKKLNADLAISILDTADGKVTELYHDPEWACFEARPLAPREVQPVVPVRYDRREPTGIIQCQSAFNARDPRLARRAKWIRIIDSKQYVARWNKHADEKEVRKNNYFDNQDWKNHQGSVARVLGCFPLADDGSFNIEVPGDRMIQCQLLDADRYPIGTQFVWFNVRPGETKGCVGCHEMPTAAAVTKPFQAARQAPVLAYPNGSNYHYRAIMWRRFDPYIPDHVEEDLSIVNSLSNLARP